MGNAFERIVIKKLIPLSIIMLFGCSLVLDNVIVYMLPAVVIGFVFVAVFTMFFFVVNMITG